MLKVVVFVVILASSLTVCVESSEIKLISPIGAASRSIFPGWGQIYTHHKWKGVIIFLSVGAFGGAGVQADAIYRDFYNNKYSPAVETDSPKTDFYYDKSNQYYKLSRFLLYTAAGIWAYSAADAYVDAQIYNARQQAEMLNIDDKKLQQLKLGAGLDSDWHFCDSEKVNFPLRLGLGPSLSFISAVCFPSKRFTESDKNCIVAVR